jgi:hypothetical protein
MKCTIYLLTYGVSLHESGPLDLASTRRFTLATMCGRWIRSTIDAIQAARRGLRSRSLDVHLDIVITDRMNTYYLQIVCLAIVSGPVDEKFFFISRNSLSRTVGIYGRTAVPARADFLLWWFVWVNTYPYEI